MKTAQRILATSLELFNQHGENSVTSVDIANELDISPGNLYYHFKGKEIIVEALFELHFSQANDLLCDANTASLNIEERFYYFYLVLEKLHLYRFFYRAPMDLAEKYPDLKKGIEKLIRVLETRLTRVFTEAIERQELNIKDAELPSIVELCSLVMIQSNQYNQFKRRFDEESQIYHALGLLLSLLLPRITTDNVRLAKLQHDIAVHAFTNRD